MILQPSWCNARCCSVFSAVAAVALFVIGAVVPGVIQNIIVQKLTDQLAVPPPDAEPWRLSNWANSSNATVHPPQFVSISFYNVTNAADIVLGLTPLVERMHTEYWPSFFFVAI